MAHPDDVGEVVLALYRPKPGKDAEVRAIVARHVPTLRELGFATDRPVVLLRGSDGTYVEIFEWVRGAAQTAHSHPAVAALWNEFAEVADFPALGDLPEAARRFPHFAPADGVTI